MSYAVQTPVFEGPLDLLLHLILKQEVDLYEVSLLAIVDAFIVELERLDVCDLDTTTEFLLIAATLVELKSARLLPGRDDVELDEELLLYEERDLLHARLLECKTFKDAAAELHRMMQAAARSHPRTAGLEERFLAVAPDLLEGVSPSEVHAAFIKVMSPPPRPRVDLDHVAPIRASVRDAAVELARLLPGMGVTSFRALTEGVTERLEIIVRFLAVLELCKQGLVELRQTATFGTLEVTWTADAEAVAASVDGYEG
jgi:segregation and condensation protein A